MFVLIVYPYSFKYKRPVNLLKVKNLNYTNNNLTICYDDRRYISCKKNLIISLFPLKTLSMYGRILKLIIIIYQLTYTLHFKRALTAFGTCKTRNTKNRLVSRKPDICRQLEPTLCSQTYH